MPERKPVTCGTPSAYRRGCRCDVCRANHAQRCAEQKRARLQRTVPDSVHGTYGGYINWGCRCDQCSKARLSRDSAQYQARKLREPPKNVHGTNYCYSSWGCRCRACTEAASEYRRMRAERHA